MDEILKEINQSIRSDEGVAICCKDVETLDKAYALIALYRYIKDEDRRVAIIIANKPKAAIKKVFEDLKVPYSSKVKPLSYVVTIDYAKANLEKITHDIDEKTGKVFFYIVTNSGNFDFNNVQYSQSGSNYGVTVVFDLDKYEDLGDVYEKNEYLFRKNRVISFTKSNSALGDIVYALDDEASYSETIYNLIKVVEDKQIEPSVVDVIMRGIVNHYKLLEGCVKTETWSMIAEMISVGADFKKVLNAVYFSKSYNNLDLQIKLMHNIRVDKEARIVWSLVNFDDVKYCKITKDNLDVRGKIIFNVSSDFDIAVAAYEVENSMIVVVIESNNPEKYSAVKLAKVLNGVGDECHAICVLKDVPAKDFQNRFFNAVKELYGISTKFNSLAFKTSTDQNLMQNNDNLTKSPQYSKNDRSAQPTDPSSEIIIGY